MICCVSRAELNRLEKLFNDWVSLFFLRKQLKHFFLSVLTNASSAMPCCLQELWICQICYDTKRFSFSLTLMLRRVIALYFVYLFVCQKVKISRGTLRARIFSGGFLHLFKTSRDLCLRFARTNLRKYMYCLQFTEPLLEYWRDNPKV